MTGRIVNVRPKPGFAFDGASIVPSGNVVPMRARDSLMNAMSGQGTGRDIRSHATYALTRALTQHEIAAAYSGSGLMRKICQIPALDMVREWRTWGGIDADAIARVYAEEKRLGLMQKVRQVEVLRALGGGALILGLPGSPSEPAPKGGKLAFVHVVSRWHLTFDQLQNDATKEGHGEPLMWKLTVEGGQQTIHPSRVIPFRADTTAALALPGFGGHDQFWGESVVAQVLDAVKDSDTARGAFASLINKARLLRIGMPGLYETIAGGKWQSVSDRLAALAVAESIHNATIYDSGDSEGKGGEEVKDANYTFAGAKDVLNAYGEFVAAISDIPATRLLGRAPEGMNASGESQQKDWQKRIRAQQTLELAPCLDRLDPHLLASAGAPSGATYTFDPLDTPSDKERVETFKVFTEGLEKLQASATIPDEALNRGVQSYMIEEGFMPELEAALAEMPDDERYGLSVERGALEAEGGGRNLEGGAGVEEAPPLRRAANDAKPRPLYVKRRLLNGADLIAWAKKNGFTTTLPAADMHVTVLYSRTPVDPIEMGETWSSDEDGGLTIKAGGPRALERFNEGAVVLQFASSGLQYRHREMVEKGASHDWPEYLPHVTLSYDAPEGLDLDVIKPFAGELRFGPEEFEPLDEDWKSKLEEA